MKYCLAIAVVLFASVAAACPPVAVQSFGVQTLAVACPSVAVQSFAVAVPQVQVQTFAVQQQVVQAQAVAFQAQAVALAAPLLVQQVSACGSGGCTAARARGGLFSRVLGSRSRSVSKAVSVQR